MGNLLAHSQLGAYQTIVTDALAEMEAERVLPRIWEGDHTVWRPDPAEITNRLGWLNLPAEMVAEMPRLSALRDTLLAEGYRNVLVLGMGGSSLAPEIFGQLFAGAEPGLQLEVLDSTSPAAVRGYAERFKLAETLYIVATKSGGTAETLSFFKYFYTRAVKELGEEEAGKHFIAITDPGSKLAPLVEKFAFREVFLNNPEVGGRYSALSYFGLVPAALAGVDVARLLERALAMRATCGPEVPVAENPGAWLGVVLGELAKVGRDKLTFVTSPAISPFCNWVEQIVAESTGKEGCGILPVVAESPCAPEEYGADRLFVYMALPGDTAHEAALAALVAVGHPLVRIFLADRYDIGALFFLWGMATAVAGARLDVQPFDQPNVESAKNQARQMVAAYRETGALPAGEVAPLDAEIFRVFLAQAQPGDYIALQAFLPPTDEIDGALRALRVALLERTHLATTLGFGPRFLHSTGQLHKGDSGNGLFIQLTADAEHDLPIPDAAGSWDSAITFGVLQAAQAQGDYRALRGEGRRVIHFHLGTEVVQGIEELRIAVAGLLTETSS